MGRFLHRALGFGVCRRTPRRLPHGVRRGQSGGVGSSGSFVARSSGFADRETFGSVGDSSVHPSRGAGFGVLGPFVSEVGVSDVFVNPDGAVWCDRGRGAERADGIRIPSG